MIRHRTHHPLVVILAVLGLVMWFRAAAFASGPIGIYALIDKVVFEPNETAPDRVQIWGAFVIADRQQGRPVFPAKRGYLYFQLPGEGVWREGMSRSEVARREWGDLTAVAGTEHAVGFASSWVGSDISASVDPYRVRPLSEPPAAPNAYVLNAGVVQLHAGGSSDEILNQLRAAHEK